MENLETIIKNIGQSKRIAVVLPEQATVDAFCAAIALKYSLSMQAHNPEVMVFCASPAPQLPFLSQDGRVPSIYNALSSTNQLVVNISNQHAQAKELRYEKTDDGLRVFITPGEGQFVEQDVSVLPAAGHFDLVIIIGASNFEQLGKIYTDNTKLFFETPHINIDTNPGNEFYGTVNLVVTTASSLCEVVMDVIEMLPGGMNEFVATGLLAGIISQTSSFRDPKTTPSALQKASRLVAVGGKQQEIIQHLFKTKPMALLQLWGRALARLTARPDKLALTAVVTASDMQKTQSQLDSLPMVLRDIIEMVTGFSLVAFLAELPPSADGAIGGTQILIAGLPYEKITAMLSELGATGSKPTALIGQYQYVSSHVVMPMPEVQAKLTQLIEKRDSVL